MSWRRTRKRGWGEKVEGTEWAVHRPFRRYDMLAYMNMISQYKSRSMFQLYPIAFLSSIFGIMITFAYLPAPLTHISS